MINDSNEWVSILIFIFVVSGVVYGIIELLEPAKSKIKQAAFALLITMGIIFVLGMYMRGMH